MYKTIVVKKMNKTDRKKSAEHPILGAQRYFSWQWRKIIRKYHLKTHLRYIMIFLMKMKYVIQNVWKRKENIYIYRQTESDRKFIGSEVRLQNLKNALFFKHNYSVLFTFMMVLVSIFFIFVTIMAPGMHWVHFTNMGMFHLPIISWTMSTLC